MQKMIKLFSGIAMALALIFGPSMAKASAGTEMQCYKLEEFVADHKKTVPVPFVYEGKEAAALIEYGNSRRVRAGAKAIEADVVAYGWGYFPDGVPAVYWAVFNKGCLVPGFAGKATPTQWHWLKRLSGVVSNGLKYVPPVPELPKQAI